MKTGKVNRKINKKDKNIFLAIEQGNLNNQYFIASNQNIYYQNFFLLFYKNYKITKLLLQNLTHSKLCEMARNSLQNFWN